MSAGEQAFLAWCELADYASDDRDAPHAEAFFAGYDAGHSERSRVRRWFFGQSKPYEVHGGHPPMPRPPEDRGKPC